MTIQLQTTKSLIGYRRIYLCTRDDDNFFMFLLSRIFIHFCFTGQARRAAVANDAAELVDWGQEWINSVC